jgi:hypothetical protein
VLVAGQGGTLDGLTATLTKLLSDRGEHSLESNGQLNRPM